MANNLKLKTMAERVQELAIAMEVELGWTPEECNEYKHFEDARDAFIAEHFESQGYDMQKFWDLQEGPYFIG